MATPVPYTGAPQVAPEDRPVPYTQLNVPGAAFGLGKAEATQQLGGAFKEAGGEIYARAVAMQELNEQAKANEAVANAQQEQMKGYLDFTQKRGADAGPEAYNEFIGNMNDIRSRIRGTLSSPYSQRLYDNESRNATNRIIFSGGIHAKDQLRQYSQGALQAGIGTAQRAVGINPEDEASFQSGLGTVEEKAKAFAAGEGFSPEKTALYVAQEKETFAAARVQGMIKSQSATAGKLLDKYSKAGLIGPQEGARLKDKVDAAMLNIGSRISSSDLMSGAGGDFGKGKVDINLAAEAVASVESTNKWIGYHPPVPEGMKHAGARAMGRYGIMDFNLQPWLKEAGMPAMTEQEFIDDHAAQTQLFKFKYGQLRERLGSDNAAASAWLGTGPSDGRTSQGQYNARFNAYLAHHSSESDVDKTARAKAESESPGNTQYADAVSSRSIIHYNEQQRMDLADQRRAQQSVAAAFEPGEDGRLITNKDQLLANPDTAAAWDKLKPSERLGWENRLAANAKNGGYALTPESTDTYQHYMGLAMSEDLTPDQKRELLDFSPGSSKVPWNLVGKIRQAQAAVEKGMVVDPKMPGYLKVLAPMMQEAGISNKKDDEDRLQFIGALHEAVEREALLNMKAPDADKIQEIGSRLIQDTLIGKHWTSRNVPLGQGGDISGKFYQFEVPEAQKNMIIQKYQQVHNGATPTPLMIHNIYIASKYQDQVDSDSKRAGSPR